MSNTVDPVQAVIIDAYQYEAVTDVNGSALKPSGSGRFAGRLVVELADGSSQQFEGVFSRSDFVSRYGFALMSFDEMADYEARSFDERYQELKGEVDADTLRRLSNLRGV